MQDWQLTYTGYRYDVSGRPVGEQKPNGLATEYGYDSAGHLTLLRNTLGANEISSFSYSYDPLGNRTTVTETLLQPAGDLIFADGFESGDFSAWSGVVQRDPADLQVTSAAALFGGFGMQAYPLFRELSLAYDNSPLDETQYRMRVYFDPNDLVVGNSGSHLHTILKLYTSDYEMIGSGSTVALIELQKSGSVYQARIGVRSDAGELAYSSWYDLANAPNALELAWQAASAPGANDGSLVLWINGNLATTLSNVDNDSVRVESVALGAVDGVDRGAAGSYCFDAFVSSRGEYIGLEQDQPLACGAGLEAMQGSLALESEAIAAEAVAAETMFEAPSFPAIPFDWLPWSGLAYLSPTETITVSGFLNTGQWFPGGLPAPADSFISSDGVTVTLLLSATTTLAVEDSGGVILEQPLEAFTLDAPAAPLAMQSASTVVIAYTYDPMNRLTAADYDNGVYFHYTYDPVGNGLTQTSSLNQGNPDVYVYDSANRLTSVNGQSYTWDNNGNLLDDGVYSYAYDRANRLAVVRGPEVSSTYAYNGLGERMQQTVDVQTTDFIVDQAGGLTQVLSDGADSYLYGLRRIAEQGAEGWQYYVTDALGSVRQLVNESGEVRLAKEYEPYGEVLSSAGEAESKHGFAGEWTDEYTNLVYLRARHYAPSQGRFLTRDMWRGDYSRPMSLNAWLYGNTNPINFIDPSGLFPIVSGIDDLPVRLLDPRSLGYIVGENVDLLPYLFYLDPYDFSFTSSINYSVDNALAERAISILAKKFSSIIGQGNIPNLPGEENYPTEFIIEMLEGETFWRRLIEVHGSQQNLFSAWFVTDNVMGKTMVAETFPLNPLGNLSDIRASVYLKPTTQGNRKQIVLNSEYMRLSFDYTFWLLIHSSCITIRIPLSFPIQSPLIETGRYYSVGFSTGQTGDRTIETVGEIRLLGGYNPVGTVTLRGSYTGPEWKLRVLDSQIAPQKK